MGVSMVQRKLCARFGVEPVEARSDHTAGVARSVGRLVPVHGLRHPPVGDTTGWYLSAGDEWSDDADFFQPMHVLHIEAEFPVIVPYLALPPGWRFLIAPGHEDVWADPSLLDIE